MNSQGGRVRGEGGGAGEELEEEAGAVDDLNLEFCDVSRMGKDLAGGRSSAWWEPGEECEMQPWEGEECKSTGERLYKFVFLINFKKIEPLLIYKVVVNSKVIRLYT